MTKQYSTITTEFYNVSAAPSEVSLLLEQKPFPRNSGDILTMDQIAEANDWEWIRVLSGGTAMSSDFDKIVEAYYAQCGKNEDGSISSTIYVFKAPKNLSYKLVTNSGVFSSTCVTESVLKEESINFRLDAFVSLNYIIDSVVSVEWEGGVYSSDGNKIQIPNPVVSGNYLVATQPVFGTARIKYKIFGDAWGLDVPMREDTTYQSNVLAFYNNNQVETLNVDFPNLSDLCSATATVCLGDCETEESTTTSTTTDDDGVVYPYPGADAPGGDYGDLVPIEISLDPEGGGCEALIEIELEPGCPAGTTDLEWDDVYSDDTIAPGGQASVGVKYGYPPYEWRIIAGYGYSLDLYLTTSVTNVLHADSDACGTAQIKVVDMCQTEITGEVDSTVSSELNWDWITSADTIIQGQSGVTIAVLDGTSPYSWSVSGQGFTLGQDSTVGKLNTIHADWCACGSAEITVIDACGAEALGSVRCIDSGEWEEIGGTLIELRDYVSSGACVSGSHIEGVQGKYKMDEEYGICCQGFSVCSTGYTCTGMGSYHEPFDHSVLVNAGEPMDCMTMKGLPGCSSYGDTKVGDCCKALGSNAINKMGVFQRKVWEWVCEEDFNVEYDWDASAQTVLKSANADVYVKNGFPPYDWEITGTGFSLAHAQTGGLVNNVNASAIACGTATITIKDRCNIETTGTIRCSDGGSWVLFSEGLVASPIEGQGTCLTGAPITDVELIMGGYKLNEFVASVCYSTGFGDCPSAPGCDNCDVVVYPNWDPYMYSFPDYKSTPIHCKNFSDIYPCMYAAGIGGGECCVSGTGYVHRIGVIDRKIYKWECP